MTEAEFAKRVYSFKLSIHNLLVEVCREFPDQGPYTCLPPEQGPGVVLYIPMIDHALLDVLAWKAVIDQGTALDHCPLIPPTALER
jgi:hypothetical protein